VGHTPRGEVWGKPFRWIRGRRLGGRTLTWDAVTPRLSNFELEAAELDGYSGARMGSSPRDSVVDPYCRVWDAPNVYVTDGACWPTSGWQNPTLTEMAITARAADHAAAQLARREL
jgi:choline dehydrogenase-like flavoprotein